MTIFYEEFINNISLIDNKDSSSHFQTHLNYAYIITCMERYFSKAMIYTMDANQECYKQIATKINNTAKLSTIFGKGLDKFIKEDILVNFQYHNIYQVKIYYENAFDVKFPSNLKSISEAIGKRHDIVHRCGFSKKDKLVNISFEDVEQLREDVTKLIDDIDKQLESKYYILH